MRFFSATRPGKRQPLLDTLSLTFRRSGARFALRLRLALTKNRRLQKVLQELAFAGTLLTVRHYVQKQGGHVVGPIRCQREPYGS